MFDFFKQEREAYEMAKKRFDGLNERDRSRRLDAILGNQLSGSGIQGFIPVSTAFNDNGSKRDDDDTEGTKPSWADPTKTEFISFEEFTRYRETSSEALRCAYNDLLKTPECSDVKPSNEVLDNLEKLSEEQPGVSWSGLGSDRKWLVQLYSKDAFKRFGGLGIVDQGLLPMGVMTLLRKRKVVWQTVL